MTAMPTDTIPPELAIDDEPFTLEQLDAELHSHGDPDAAAAHTVERWTITDAGAAEWAMAHVAAIDANLAELAEQHAAYLERIERWHKAAASKLDQRRGFFAAHLERYAAEHRARDPKRNKTLSLPSGKVSSTETHPKVAIADEATLIAWARDHMTDEDLAEVVKVTESAKVMELRKRVQIVRQPVGWEVELDCGHMAFLPPADPDGQPWVPNRIRADGVVCERCDPDPITGFPLRHAVTVGDWDEPVAVLPQPEGKSLPVAGASIDAGGVTYRVVTR